MRLKAPKLFFLFFLFLEMSLQAVPAYRGIVSVKQQDGSVLKLRILGDEYANLSMTEEGCAVVMDAQGRYCYALFDEKGQRRSSGYEVGSNLPQRIKEQSRRIPYDLLNSAMVTRRVENLIYKAPQKRVRSKSDGQESKRVIVIMAQFSDLPFREGNDVNAFDLLFNQEGYSQNNASGSVKDYLKSQFDGKMSFSFDVAPVVTLSKAFSYYGENDEYGYDKRALELVYEACELSKLYVDFAEYDDLLLIYSGGTPSDGSASEDHIWPHQSTNKVNVGTKVFDGYAMCSELMTNMSNGDLVMTSIGTICHEYSHILGLVDLYDTEFVGTSMESESMWKSTSIMDAGNYNNNGHTPPCYNAIELEALGIIEPEPLSSGMLTLTPISENKKVYRWNTENEGEYYLFECRAATGWDKYMCDNHNTGASGMLVYHVDKSQNMSGYSPTYMRNVTAAARWELNIVNSNREHQCADLVEAKVNARNISEIFFGNGDANSFSASTKPSFRAWDGTVSPFVISSISKEGNNIVMNITGPISIDSRNVFQDAAILQWSTDLEEFMDEPSYLRFKTGDAEDIILRVPPYDSGKYSWTFEELSPDTDYEVTLYFEHTEEGSEVKTEFRTKPMKDSVYPYIYLADVERTISGFFPQGCALSLRVYNAKAVNSITWYYNSQQINVGADGYFYPDVSGELKAVLKYLDGSEEIIVKEVQLKQ